MNIVLVCINNFQDYILTNIDQLIKLGHENIFILTNQHFFEKFEYYKDKIHLIAIDDLKDSYDYFKNSSLDKVFRNGFFSLASLRFFYIYSFMKKYNIKNVIHLENDVLIYYNVKELQNKVNNQYIYLPFDSFKRNIASIIYIPSSEIFKKILDNYDFKKNDMENFSLIKKNHNIKIIENFPIFPNLTNASPEINFVCENYKQFECIFDAAAMGQFLGGIDPRNNSNNSNNTIGFINETCVIKYNNYHFI